MKHILAAVLAIFCTAAISAQTSDETPWRYVPDDSLRLINKGFDDTPTRYSRLPAALHDSVRQELWDLSLCSSGLALRFATDSPRIGLKYNLLRNFHMNHMTDAGIKGADLYILNHDSVWSHVNSVRPIIRDDSLLTVETKMVDNLDGDMHEYMLYLPLYDGVTDLWLKVAPEATVTSGDPALMPDTPRIVAYGTSIMQGGCASRPGMTSSNIISRRLGKQVVNLGFSGNAKLDPPLARAMAAMDGVEAYIIDPVPNCTLGMCDTLTYDFVKIIAQAHPRTPIIMVAGLIYPYAAYDSHFKQYLPEKNDAFRRNYQILKDEGYDNLIFVEADDLLGDDHEGTVDGIHLTDVGFRIYSDVLTPVIRRALQNTHN